ncbi:hypothetical protein MPTK1_6g09890 [Marchantia polymorpha subsp. ruderalis]|uniref:Uncharacterized protein n=2 Tax=Marchantia polymorpha TaxID=3197 RepID=A0AAF6BQE2_MARPO|nr:hypothetical protein MARPO_0016s0033 [Marchantia polymorpha]BBN14226.1 hypothetical protein Mp_6g09890 [Marchantia polymorpha subsp. ruderalis]|eukprot:PTQ44961.1 hypothetical protein MARPO_0016s0033 [Marchantia polymorpha]
MRRGATVPDLCTSSSKIKVVRPEVAKYIEEYTREYQIQKMPAAILAVMILLTWIPWVHRHSSKTFVQQKHKRPKKWIFIGYIIEQARNFDRMHDWLHDYHKKGCLTFSVPMITMNNTFTVDLRNVEHILKTAFSNYSKIYHSREAQRFLYFVHPHS